MEKTKDRTTWIRIAILTVLIAFMDISGIPCSLFLEIRVADIEPIYFALMLNFALIAAIAYVYLRLLCPEWKIGFTTTGFAAGIKRYGIVGISVALVGFVAFYVGLMPLDSSPTAAKVIVEGVVYYIGVAVVEELYVRGLLLNLIEKLCKNEQNKTIAVVLSSVAFGLGHIFGALGQPTFVIVSKVVWTIGMGLFFGTIYKKTNTLLLPIFFHFLINVCALPYCFSSVSGYANLTLSIILPVYLVLGVYSLIELKKDGQGRTKA